MVILMFQAMVVTFYNYVNDGGAAVSTYRRDYFNYHFLTMTMSSKYPGPEEDDYKPVTLHEFFMYINILTFQI